MTADFPTDQAARLRAQEAQFVGRAREPSPFLHQAKTIERENETMTVDFPTDQELNDIPVLSRDIRDALVEAARIGREIMEGKESYDATVDEIRDAMAHHRIPIPNLSPMAVAKTYSIYGPADTIGLLKSLPVDAFPYIPARRACDNFAVELDGLASFVFTYPSVGVVIDTSGVHAYSIIPMRWEDQIILRFWEPQGAKIVMLHTKNMYAGERGIVLFG